MTIKEVSELYDISQDTLRYYERIGMIPPVTRTPSGIRDYQESDLGWVDSPLRGRRGNRRAHMAQRLSGGFRKRI